MHRFRAERLHRDFVSRSRSQPPQTLPSLRRRVATPGADPRINKLLIDTSRSHRLKRRVDSPLGLIVMRDAADGEKMSIVPCFRRVTNTLIVRKKVLRYVCTSNRDNSSNGWKCCDWEVYCSRFNGYGKNALGSIVGSLKGDVAWLSMCGRSVAVEDGFTC